MDQWQIILLIISALAAAAGLVITFFGFIGATLLGIVGYFLKNFHAEYKQDKLKEVSKDAKIEERFQRMTDTIGSKFDGLIDKMGEKINNLPKGSDSLNQLFNQYEKQSLEKEILLSKRMDEHGQRIQNMYLRTEEIAKRVHEHFNRETGPDLMRQVEQLRARKKLEEEALNP